MYFYTRTKSIINLIDNIRVLIYQIKWRKSEESSPSIYSVTKTKNNNKNNWGGRPRYIEDWNYHQNWDRSGSPLGWRWNYLNWTLLTTDLSTRQLLIKTRSMGGNQRRQKIFILWKSCFVLPVRGAQNEGCPKWWHIFSMDCNIKNYWNHFVPFSRMHFNFFF